MLTPANRVFLLSLYTFLYVCLSAIDVLKAHELPLDARHHHPHPHPDISRGLFAPESVWHLPSPNNSSPTAGYPVIPSSVLTTRHIYIADNSSTGWGTYAHHPHVYIHAVNDADSIILLSFSNHMVDEDADGQQVLYTLSANNGVTFTPIDSLFPPALGPGEQPTPFRGNSLQRAMCSEGFLMDDSQQLWALAELYGVSDVSGIPEEGSGWKQTGFGRVARRMDSNTGKPVDDPCWLQTSIYVSALNNTPYDVNTMPFCPQSDALLLLTSQSTNQPAWSWSLMSDNHQVHADTQDSHVCEPTHGLPWGDAESGSSASQTCRLWRVLSSPAPGSSRTMDMECVSTSSPSPPNDWFNGTAADWPDANGWYGPYKTIQRTNIPDANSKAFFGKIAAEIPAPTTAPPTATATATSTPSHYLVHNPRADGSRIPLTLTTSTDGVSLTAIGVLQSADTSPRYDGRYKNSGYQYPHATVAGNILWVTYSVNKEDIWLTTIQVQHLPIRAPVPAPASARRGHQS